jgi:hypothetical protein
MCKGRRTCLTRSLISTCVWLLMSLVGAPRWVMLSRSVLTNCLLDLMCSSMGLSTNKKLSRGNATIDHRSVRVDGIGSHWFVTRTYVQGRIWRLLSFLEYSTHGHACELSSVLKHLLDGINRQPTEMRAKLSVVRFRSHDKLRSSLYCFMVAKQRNEHD